MSKRARKPALLLSEQTIAGRVLLALRAGPIESTALRERLGESASPIATKLHKEGLLVLHNGTAHITSAGLKNCPSRRPTTSV